MRTALKTLAGAAKKLEADRVETLAPYRKASETIQAAYKRLAEWLAGATWDLKGRMEALVREAARIAAARAEAEAAAATSNRPTAPLLPRTVEEVKPAFSTYTVTHLEITAPGSIPREFMVPDTAKIRAYLDAGNTVPWARLVTETKVAAR